MFPSLNSRQTGASHRRATRIGRNSRAKTPPTRGEVEDMEAAKQQPPAARESVHHVSQPESRRQLQRERAVLRKEISGLKEKLADATFAKIQAVTAADLKETAYARRSGWDLMKTGLKRIFGK